MRFGARSVALRWRPGLVVAAALSLAGEAQGLHGLQVVDGSGQPVSGARIEVLERRNGVPGLMAWAPPLLKGVSGPDGRPPFTLPARTGLLLLVDHPDYAPLLAANLPAGSPQVFALTPGHTQRGRVSFGPGQLQGGEACASWSKSFPAWRHESGWRRCVPISGQGRFELRGLAVEDLDLSLSAPGFLRTVRRLRPSRTPVRLSLQRGIPVAGRVVGSGKGSPLPGARIECAGSSEVSTGAEGRFEVGVRAFPSTLRVSALGFRGREVKVEKQPASSGLEIQLDKAEQLVGTLTGPNGDPIQQAVMWLASTGEGGRRRSESREVKTEKGRFVFDLPAAGRYALRIQATGYRDEILTDLEVGAGDSHALGTIVLRRGAGVRGVVLDARDGEPVAAAEVEALPTGLALVDAVSHQRLGRAVSLADGSFELNGLDAGRVSLRVRRDGFADAATAVDLVAEGVADLGAVRLERGVKVLGSVVDRAGRARPAVGVRFFDAEQSRLLPLAEAMAGEDGRFGPLVLAPARYRVEVRGEKTLLAQEIEVPAGQEEWPLELSLPGANASGRVVRAGRPVGGGSISLRSLLDPGARRGKIALHRGGEGSGAGEFRYGWPDSLQWAGVAEDGTFEVKDAPAGAVEVTYVTPEAGLEIRRQLTLLDEPTSRLLVEIGGVALRGRTIDRALGSGVASRIEVTADSGEVAASLEADADGFFSADGLAAGAYRLTATARGYGSEVRERIVLADEAPLLELALSRGASGSLLFRIRRDSGAFASWVPVSLLAAGGGMVQAGVTDAQGEVRLRDLPPGRYAVAWTDGSSGAGALGGLTVEEGSERVAGADLSAGSTLVLSCREERCGGRPVETLSIRTEEGVELAPFLSGMSSALRFSDRGSLTLGRLSRGRYTVQVTVRGKVSTARFEADGEAMIVSLDGP